MLTLGAVRLAAAEALNTSDDSDMLAEANTTSLSGRREVTGGRRKRGQWLVVKVDSRWRLPGIRGAWNGSQSFKTNVLRSLHVVEYVAATMSALGAGRASSKDMAQL